MEDGHPQGLTAYAMRKIGAGFELPGRLFVVSPSRRDVGLSTCRLT